MQCHICGAEAQRACFRCGQFFCSQHEGADPRIVRYPPLLCKLCEAHPLVNSARWAFVVLAIGAIFGLAFFLVWLMAS